MARPHTFPESFHHCGNTLCETMAWNSSSEKDTTYYHWIDEAPTHAKIEDLANWGLVLSMMLGTDKRDLAKEKQNARRLGDYFSAFINLAGQDWTAIGKHHKRKVRNPYNMFHLLVLGAARHQGSHPVFTALIQQGWVPDTLLATIEKVEALSDNRADNSFRHSSIGQMCRILWPLMHDTDWRPSDNGLYACMLSVNEIDASLHESQCAATFSKCVPSQNAEVLYKLLQSTRIAPESIGPFFPIDVSSCDAYSVLNTFVGLLTEGGRDDPTYKALIVEQQLRMHHPELASLLNMHLTLFSEASETKSFAEVLVPGFDALYGRDVNPAEVIIGDFFDDDNDNAIGSGMFK